MNNQGFQLSEALPVGEDFNQKSIKGYSTQEIEAIRDPAAASDNYQITSVPSPYARWHLIDQAFAWVTDRARNSRGQELTGETIYHKLVAEALDVGEIMFAHKAINARGDRKVEIKSVPFYNEIQQLKNSDDPRERNLGETYDLFHEIHTDENNVIDLYNAKELQILYIDGIPVGGTNPLSLYYTGVDDLSRFAFRLDRTVMFQHPHESLLERGQSFILSQVAMVNDFRSLMARHMPGFTAYVDYVKGQMTERPDLEKYSEELVNKYVNRRFGGDTRTLLETSDGQQAYLYTPEAATVNNSDLILGTLDGSKPSTKLRRPLVLLPDFRQAAIYYDKVKWSAKVLTDFVGHPENISERMLPGQFIKYPWITTSDFLEPIIYRLAGPLNAERFRTNPGHRFDRNISQERGDYLLPIKPLFFRYFTAEQLFGEVSGRPMFEMQRSSDDRSVTVTLRLPIGEQGKFVDMSRTYDSSQIADEAKNIGGLVRLKVNLALIPDVAVSKYTEGEVMLQEVQTDDHHLHLDLYASGQQTVGEPLLPLGKREEPTVRVDPVRNARQNTIVYHPEERFDMMRLRTDKAGGWIMLTGVPAGDTPATKEFDLAIDFGTANTHVELRERSGGGSKFESFSLSEPGLALRTLYHPAFEPSGGGLKEPIFQRSFFHEIGPGKKYSFPLATAIAESDAYAGSKVMPVALRNIPFYYRYEQSPEPDTIHTNLKWSDLSRAEDQSRLNHFIAATLQLAAFEISARGGDLSKVRLVYFYPSSMEPFRQSELAKAWTKAYERYFDKSSGYVQALSESVAPYQYFFLTEQSVWREERTINCDIGGGTCDAYINYSTDGKDAKIASFRFAGRDVFGDGFDSHKGKANGFVKACEDAVASALKGSTADHERTRAAYEQLLSRSVSSEEIIGFYLSLNNEKIHDSVHFDFNQHIKLNRPQLRLIYLLYYGAVMYHLLEVTRSLGLDQPTDMTFTGNGSKILRELAPDHILSALAGFIAEGVYGKSENDDPPAKIRITTFENPKDYTSKGGLSMLQFTNELDTMHQPPPNVVTLGTDAERSGEGTFLVGENNRVYGGTAPTYDALNQSDEFRAKTIENVERFLDLLFAINDRYSFKSNLHVNINDWDGVKAMLKRDLGKGYTAGIKQRSGGGNGKQTLTETLFFPPLTNALYQMGQELAKNAL